MVLTELDIARTTSVGCGCSRTPQEQNCQLNRYFCLHSIHELAPSGCVHLCPHVYGKRKRQLKPIFLFSCLSSHCQKPVIEELGLLSSTTFLWCCCSFCCVS
ncbi:hypothetical protein IscW_ISCW012176 [Ixodes scapularis]|uniref:Uncharacterized protein n=1 Tax=Ixodes scapularis TaxID=6945 RepID=B7QBP5_IXOSC|nr:hypothetical protein IscW_ISCW012176 [Ixodes scapularis]|eukprot:XP_002412959.1 hypothetical protein IscW_ISCW012176 [Ixodes scapularis]